MPHYVTFQSAMDRLRTTQEKATQGKATQSTATVTKGAPA